MRALSVIAVFTVSTVAAADPVQTIVDNATATLRAKSTFAGAIVGTLDAHGQHVYAYGKTVTATPQPITASTLFRVASITKTFTATLLALMTNGTSTSGMHVKFSDTDPTADTTVAQLMTKVGASCTPTHRRKNVTLADLADHHSGLARAPDRAVPTVDDLFKDFCACPIVCDSSSAASLADCHASDACPGTGTGCRCQAPGSYNYSSYGFSVLGQLLGLLDASHDYTTAVANSIAVPLGMPNTVFANQLTVAQKTALAIIPDPSSKHPENGALVETPAGGLYMTATDLMVWLAFNTGPTPCTAINVQGAQICRLQNTLPLMFYQRATTCAAGATCNGHVGLGWQMANITVGGAANTLYYKDGDVIGYHSYIAFTRNKTIGAFIVINADINGANLNDIVRTIITNLDALP